MAATLGASCCNPGSHGFGKCWLSTTLHQWACTLSQHLPKPRNPDWTTPTPLCMERQHKTCTNYSLPRILLLVWFCLLFAIFHQVSDLVTSTGFLFTTKYSSISLHLPVRPQQPVSHLISTISSDYTSHHKLCVIQPNNYSKYHICLQILVGTPSATALLQHEIPFLPPSKIVRPYIVSSAT